MPAPPTDQRKGRGDLSECESEIGFPPNRKRKALSGKRPDQVRDFFGSGTLPDLDGPGASSKKEQMIELAPECACQFYDQQRTIVSQTVPH